MRGLVIDGMVSPPSSLSDAVDDLLGAEREARRRRGPESSSRSPTPGLDGDERCAAARRGSARRRSSARGASTNSRTSSTKGNPRTRMKSAAMPASASSSSASRTARSQLPSVMTPIVAPSRRSMTGAGTWRGRGRVLQLQAVDDLLVLVGDSRCSCPNLSWPDPRMKYAPFSSEPGRVRGVTNSSSSSV